MDTAATLAPATSAPRSGAPADTNPQVGRSSRATVRHTSARTAVVALLVAVLTAVGVLAAGPAGAYTTTASQGVPVAPTVYQVQGSHYNIGSTVTGPMYRQWLYQSGPIVYRVAGSGTQTVKVVYRIDRWNGSSWVQRQTAQGSVKIGSSVTSATAPALSIYPSDGAGYYRIRIDMTWTSAIGAYLGSTSVRMDGSRDYVCSTTRTCSVGAGYVYLGA